MKIAIDIDEVLADTLRAFIKKYNQKYHTKFKRENFYTYNWWEVLDITKEECGKILVNFIDAGFTGNLNVVRGSKQGIKALAKKHELFLVTSRAENIKKITAKWINKNFKVNFKDIIYTRDTIFSKEKESKFEICHRIKADVLIEDWVDHANDCAINGLKVLLFDCPWNRGIKLLPKMRRVKSWNDILTILN